MQLLHPWMIESLCTAFEDRLSRVVKLRAQFLIEEQIWVILNAICLEKCTKICLSVQGMCHFKKVQLPPEEVLLLKVGM